jgi:hypothetical protein
MHAAFRELPKPFRFYHLAELLFIKAGQLCVQPGGIYDDLKRSGRKKLETLPHKNVKHPVDS